MGKVLRQKTDGLSAGCVMGFAEGRKDFAMSDEEFKAFVEYHLATCEKRELIGSSSHLLYICKKK